MNEMMVSVNDHDSIHSPQRTRIVVIVDQLRTRSVQGIRDPSFMKMAVVRTPKEKATRSFASILVHTN